jgi:hypothetical protein
MQSLGMQMYIHAIEGMSRALRPGVGSGGAPRGSTEDDRSRRLFTLPALAAAESVLARKHVATLTDNVPLGAGEHLIALDSHARLRQTRTHGSGLSCLWPVQRRMMGSSLLTAIDYDFQNHVSIRKTDMIRKRPGAEWRFAGPQGVA